MLNGSIPPFDLQGGMTLALVRFLFLAAVFSAFGTLAVGLLAAPALARTPPETGAAIRRRLRLLALLSLAAALVAGVLWFVAEAAVLSEATSLDDLASVLPVVARGTAFGHLILSQLFLICLAGLALGPGGRWRDRVACVLAGGVVLGQIGHSHAASMQAGFSWLAVADGAHLLAASLWLGGLLPLLLIVRYAPPRAGAGAARAFATMGRLCVLALIASAAFQGWVMIGTIPGLFGTAYGWVAGLKFLLLIVLLGFAATNRYRLAPALMRGEPERARSHLVRSIAVQTGFGVAAVGAAAVLSGLAPAMHIQPVWPFTWRLSLEAVREDPDFRREAVEAGAAMLGAVALLAVAAWLRDRRGLGLIVVAAAVAWLAAPHFGLLLAEAGPTEFYHSPSRFAAQSILRGVALYPEHCAACHGATGRGDGPAAAGLAEPPADLTAAHLWMHSDGELFGWLTSGIAAPSGAGLAMPGFGGALSEDDRWALIDAIRARNAGLNRSATGAWTPPVKAPSFESLCGDGPRSLADFSGKVVRLVIGGPAPPEAADVITILAGPAGSGSGCVTDDPAVPGAYAVISGLAPDRIAGTQFLIDAHGWLRAALPAGSLGLVAALARARAPLPASDGQARMAM